MSGFIADSAFVAVFISLASYFIGSALQKRFRLAIFNPILIAVVLTVAFVLATGTEYSDYKAKADVISWFLTPATVSLAIPLYRKISILKKNLKAVMAGILCGVVASVGCILVLCLCFSLGHEQYITLLPKSVTTAIGMGVSERMGGIPSITAVVIILTGMTGNIICPLVFRIFRIEEPVAKGIAIGTSSHALGTARAFQIGDTEGAFSSISIVVAGLLTVLFSVFLQNLV